MSEGKGSGPRAWTSPADLRARLLREWERGLLPASLVGGPNLFPLRIKLKGPSSRELSDYFGEARSWISGLAEEASSPGYRLETKAIEHRQLGANDVPVAAVFEKPEDALAYIGKRRDAARLTRLAGEIVSSFPELGSWIIKRPLVVLEREADWPALLATLAWFRAHPRSGLYARQIDAPGVHSKFVETHRGLLSELLDIVLPSGTADGSTAENSATVTGAALFARRYGLRDKPSRVRFRVLDPALRLCVGIARSPTELRPEELSLLSEDFARLFPTRDPDWSPCVFITENEINFLAFPEVTGSLIIFGSGYGFSALAPAEWLHRCRIHYWGDLDSHGFAILDQLRADFPGAQSLLMDRRTLLEHRELWTSELSPTKAELTRLSSEERELYDDLRFDRLAPALRLEQERIRFSWVESALKEI